MQDKLRQIMSKIFEVPAAQITDEAKVETIESWDSLNHINLVLALEQEFKTTFAPEEIIQMVSFREIQEILNQKMTTSEIRK